MRCKTLLLFSLLSFALCTHADAEPRKPYLNAESLKNLDPDDQRMWYASNDFEKAIRKGGQLYPSPELDAYLQSIMDRLYPEFVGNIKVHVIKSPVINAFAIPNGHIYMHTGLLSRFDNEAQLAAVLAHEGAHFVYRHGYYNQQSLKSASAFATVTAILGVPIVGLLGNVIAMSSIFGYSRELETEADNVGFKRLIAAGYDVHEAPRVFELLANEVKVSEIEEKVFYSTHPKLQDRIENYTKLAAQHEEIGDAGLDRFVAKVDQLRVESLEMELSFGRYKHIIALLSEESVFNRYPPTAHYYLGEAYRKRNAKDDIAMAVAQFEKAIALIPEFPQTYRGMGMVKMAENKKSEATTYFKKYLELAPNAKDSSYVMEYLDNLKNN